MTTLANLKLAALVTLHNAAIVDYAPEGFEEVAKFASKAKAIEALDALCAAGNLAIAFDGDTATIVDALESADDSATLGDGKGKARDWGFVTASDDWLKANARGTEAREEYRAARRKAARMARKSARKAKEAAHAGEVE